QPPWCCFQWAGSSLCTRAASSPLCFLFQSEYHYEYTACDSLGSRWRVAVPHTPGLCTGLPDPIKGTECSFSCKAGQFLDMKDQSCKPCAEGRYSLGTGIRFDEWDELPHGFASIATNLESDSSISDLWPPKGCPGSTWLALGDYVASNTDECTATLMYAVNLKQSGTVSFEYIYPDSSIVFEFFVQNDQCQPTVEESRWMRTTEKGWETHNVELSRGNNVLYWRTTAFSVWSKVPKPVLVRNIGITGVAYTSECFPCKAGTYAPTSGSSFCQLCPANSYSSKGATSCQRCEPDTYSGSSSCKPRPPCTDKDYFYTHTACDASGETQLMFKWAEPKTCSEDLPTAIHLPPSEVKTKCPPCNPGFFKTNSSACEPCPSGSYSNGSGCISCAAGTEPALGFEYKWWNTLPANMETTVLSGINFEYKGMAGWEVAGDYIYTAAGASDNDFMILTMVVPGFRPPQAVLEDVENKEVARITFVFETVCSVNCELYFMVGVNSRTNTPVETWNGSKEKQSYTYIIEKNATMSFTWAFQRTAYHEAVRGQQPSPKAPCSPVLETISLANSTSFTGGPSFTSKGLKYFHHFSISLCGNHGRKMATCMDNVTDMRVPDGEAEFSKSVTSYVCQSIIVPSDVMGYKTIVSSQPVSLADRVIGRCFFPWSRDGDWSNDVTQSCRSGRATAIHLRCDPLKTGSGALSLPSKCPDGTCDGCTFHFLWETSTACPLCSAYDYHAIISACLGGIQRTTYVWREPKLCSGGVPLPEQKVSICKTMDFWLKVGISAGTCAAVLLTVMTCYFWKKNQKLEYKYSKLVMNSTAKDSELPAADSCAIMEGEDVEDDLIFTSKKSLFGKIKSFTYKRTSDGFDSVPLKTSSGSTDMDL
uniref:Endosome-lysosome associated apoptosis and autophagy regulator 1 n=1 Tax=Chelonoidis abingdonii TaxID=106734 RepID=A0A8C0H422_CHEAB